MGNSSPCECTCIKSGEQQTLSSLALTENYSIIQMTIGYYVPYTIIFQTVWHFASASGLELSHDDHNKDNDWIFNLNEISISNTNQTIQWPMACSVVEHGLIVNKTHTSIKKTVQKSVMLHISIIRIG